MINIIIRYELGIPTHQVDDTKAIPSYLLPNTSYLIRINPKHHSWIFHADVHVPIRT